jgi:flagellum-specific ATP synthase
MRDIVGREHQAAAGTVMELIARYRQSEDLILLGAYKQGMNGALDRAVQLQDAINVYLRQDIDQSSPLAQSVQSLVALAKQAA